MYILQIYLRGIKASAHIVMKRITKSSVLTRVHTGAVAPKDLVTARR
jgi:hypothetical protein